MLPAHCLTKKSLYCTRGGNLERTVPGHLSTCFGGATPHISGCEAAEKIEIFAGETYALEWILLVLASSFSNILSARRKQDLEKISVTYCTK
ncbi:Hypothetical predicted protein, partial [Paramuricea clavata]